jgi:hypothetical protein
MDNGQRRTGEKKKIKDFKNKVAVVVTIFKKARRCMTDLAMQ